MNLKQAQHIKSVYDSVEENDPDISTERLLQMTTDICHNGRDSLGRCVQDVSDVCDALILIGSLK
jgi:hypothetical protein